MGSLLAHSHVSKQIKLSADRRVHSYLSVMKIVWHPSRCKIVMTGLMG